MNYAPENDGWQEDYEDDPMILDGMTADQLRHVCETQRVAISQLQKLTSSKPRGSDGFGSTGITDTLESPNDIAERIARLHLNPLYGHGSVKEAIAEVIESERARHQVQLQAQDALLAQLLEAVKITLCTCTAYPWFVCRRCSVIRAAESLKEGVN